MINVTSFIDCLQMDVLKYADIINPLDLITRPDLTSSFSIGFLAYLLWAIAIIGRWRRRRRRRPLTFPLIDFFLRTTGPISTKLGRNDAWGWEFWCVQIKGWPLLEPNKGQKKEKFDKFSKIFF